MAPPPRPEQDTHPDDTLPFAYLVPNLVTTLGLCLGLTSIRFAIGGQYRIAVALILCSVIIDGLDGMLARRLKATSEFGAQFDSLSDFVTFGVAPGLLIYRFALSEVDRASAWIFVLVYVVCCCMRLARFNAAITRVALDQARSGAAEPAAGAAHFTGVPAPAGAFMALFPIFLGFETGFAPSAHPVLISLYLAMVGMLMVSRLPTFSPKSLRVAREQAPFVMIALALIVGVMMAAFWLSLILLNLAYMVSLVASGVSALRRRMRARAATRTGPPDTR